MARTGAGRTAYVIPDGLSADWGARGPPAYPCAVSETEIELDPAAVVHLDPEDVATAVRVLALAPSLEIDDPDFETLKRAASLMYKRLKKDRRNAKTWAERKADRQVIESTATGSPMRIDDETKGIPLVSNATGAFAGELVNPRGCYICKRDYTLVDAFYHWLCPDCAARSHGKRDQRTDLTGKRALLTGGRAKIGMYIALRLLRDGAHTTITTRFPRDAMRRFASMDDSADWIHRLKIVGIDLRDPTQVVALADEVTAAGPLDILINNAAQTVRRSPGAYSNLVELESAPLPDGVALPEMVTFDRISEAHPASIAGALGNHAVAHHDGESVEHAVAAQSAASMTALALSAGHASLEAHRAGTAVDAGGLLPDLQHNNSWTQKVEEVDPLELLEVQLCNSTAPFILVSRLRPAMRAAVAAGARRAYVVNVSAMEGQFSRRYKGPGHPHTNMAKAALNMMTRTSAGEMFETDRILMTAVDTGWITDERPHDEKLRIAAEGWHAPLDLVDGAARVYDPIVRGEAGEDLYGCFVKDYEPSPW
ncbi:SDR family NAD(P)-dependent oxidoreductase [Terrabacter ginsenosidimutans]|uniref:SDR family NAD(P)-dependent oxidoreductase n=1 Tax=Terrabacter ginsenosidimutans TaxID=490575 RepID=A0ABP7E4D5_9MICO